jgi:drug/metabolite transporter (DMT)-like permease
MNGMNSQTKQQKQLRGSLILLSGTVIWGTAFVAQSAGMEKLGPFTFQAIRCGLAVLTLALAALVTDRVFPSEKNYWQRWMNKKLWRAGLCCGIALFVASSLQQVGLQYTSSGKAGFITAMYIVIVPVLGIFFRRHVPSRTWISVALAVIGLYLLSFSGATEINQGDLLILGCAFAFSVQITIIDRMSGSLDAIRLNCIQALVVTVLSVPLMFLTEDPSLPSILESWLPLAYAGVLSMGVAYTFQIFGQRDLNPATASLIMSLEAVFAVLAGWIILHQSLSAREILGCLFEFAGVLLCSLPERKKDA